MARLQCSLLALACALLLAISSTGREPLPAWLHPSLRRAASTATFAARHRRR